MEWVKLDTSIKKFKSIEHIIKAQGHYFDRLMGYLFFKKLLSSFNATVYTAGLDKLKYHENRRVLLLPNHRSYLDPVILHNLFMLSGFKHPKVAALDFLSRTPFASICRNNGAVFIREKFDDPDYREKLNNQLKSYADNGEWVCFYLEGKRSNSGKQLAPRRGLLKAMTEDKPCVIYPINISFERTIEDKDLIVTNSAFRVLSVATSFFTPNAIGKINISFADPIYCDAGTDVYSLGNKVTRAMMKENVIYGTDLCALLLLHQHHDVVRTSKLEKEIEWLSDALTHRGVTVIETPFKTILKLLRHVISSKDDIIKIKSKPLLYYYRNRVMYAFKDLINVPDLLKYESFWEPINEPRKEDVAKLKELAATCYEPTVFLYKYVLERIRDGETNIRNIHHSINDNPNYCYETVTNCVDVLKEKGFIEVNGKTIKLLKK